MSDYNKTLSRIVYAKKNKYVDLKVNGKLFPSWILANFKEYELDEIKKTGADPCSTEGKKDIELGLRTYQVFISKYLDYNSPFRDLLIYHGLGSGKTATAINIYNALYNYTPGWNVFILLKASLRENWMQELQRWLKKDSYKFRYKNIIFINYDSPFAERDFSDALKNIDTSKKSMYIIEEVHNFIRNVYTNISSTKGKRAQVIYDSIINDKKDNPDTRVVLLSGTPVINNPFELALLFNLLRPGIFPKSENKFNHTFISHSSYDTINPNTKNMFQRRIMGLVSYYLGATPDLFASKTIHYVDVEMSEYQQEIYSFYEEIEKKIAMNAKLAQQSSQVYKSYTRQASNFVFPPISQRINGENRPRPNKFRISEHEARKLEEGKDVKGKENTLMNVSKYRTAMKNYIDGLKDYLQIANANDIKNKYTINNDVNTFLNKYKGNWKKFHEEESKKSELYKRMHMGSAKMVNMIFNIMKSPGPTVVYSNYVLMEGLEILKIYLSFFNFYSVMKTKELIKDKIGYAEFHGSIKDVKERYRGMDLYNKKSNRYGKEIKIMLISPAGTEGLSLRNVRQVHIMEPHWNEVRISQMIGRGIRQCSHGDLPMEERHVDVFRYKSVRTAKDSWTTDQYIEDLARTKEGLVTTFLDAMKEVAIDCTLFKKHNMITQEYKCFKFEEPSLFNKYVGPAYKQDMSDDINMNNGLNAPNSMSVKIKVMKIRAVTRLTSPEEEEQEFSEENNYWYYSSSGTVYDFDLHYPIGKISQDQDGLPVKLNKDVYIIDHVIPIPRIES